MYIVSPLSNCATPEKRKRFLENISKIAPVTLDTEPDCLGYAWFRGAGDNNAVPAHWVRGFEIYRAPEANSIAHRASNDYKAFRKAVSEEKLLDRPSDLRFWRPAGIGFLTRGAQEIFMDKCITGDAQYIVTEELTVEVGAKSDSWIQLQKVADEAQADATVLSFWVLCRGRNVTDTAIDATEDVYIFSRFHNVDAYQKFRGSAASSAWTKLVSTRNDHRSTTWLESGIGFIGR